MSRGLRLKHLLQAIALATAISLSAGYSLAGEIKATFLEDKTEIVIKTPTFAATASVADAREKLLSLLKQNKIDCGPKCVPKPVGDGVWECCDGRRVPPKGKVLLRIDDAQLRETAQKAFTPSRFEY